LILTNIVSPKRSIRSTWRCFGHIQPFAPLDLLLLSNILHIKGQEKNIDFDIGAKFDTPKTTQQIHFLVSPDYFSI
jgi:hypothetical protein